MLIKNNGIIRGTYAFLKEYILFRKDFGHIENTVTLCPPISFTTKKNVYLYEHSKIGEHSYIACVNAKFIMKKWAGAANGLNVHTGNHPMIVGRFYRSITNAEKGKGFDKDIIVNEDVWIGSNVTLLSGAVIGRGAIVAAGAVVNKEIPPYAIVGGIPAKFIKFKWSIEQILEHERQLYPKEERLSVEYLSDIFERFLINKQILNK